MKLHRPFCSMALLPWVRSPSFFRPRLGAVASVLWGAQALVCSAQTTELFDPNLMMQDHLRRLEQVAPRTAPTIVPKIDLPLPVAPASTAVVQIMEIQFSKSELLEMADLEAVGRRYVGRQLGTADIQALLEEVSTLYRKKGILTGVPVLPKQDLQTGVMRILLVEGRLGEVKVAPTDLAQAQWVQQWFDLEANAIVTQEALRQRLVRFNNVSDFSATAEMVAGAQFGQTDLSVAVNNTNSVQAWGFYETSSVSKASLPNQLGAGLRILPLTSQGGRLDLSAMTTEIGSTVSGTMGLPLGVEGWRTSLNLSAARSKTTLKGDQADLTIRGESSSLGWDVGRTWVLADPWVLSTAMGLSKNRSQTSVDTVPLFNRETNKLSLVSTLNHDTLNQRGFLRNSFNVSSDGSTYRYWEFLGHWRSALDDAGLWQFRTSGLLRFKPNGAVSTLDRFYLGGPDTVRGFNMGSAGGDYGAAAQLELRRNMNDMDWTSTEVYAFMDMGQAKDAQTHVGNHLRSTGLGVQAKLDDQLGIDVMATRQLSTHIAAPTRVMLRLILSY
jgi:hemolysin activation/secretion protein